VCAAARCEKACPCQSLAKAIDVRRGVRRIRRRLCEPGEVLIEAPTLAGRDLPKTLNELVGSPPRDLSHACILASQGQLRT
jgi:hypothetical protein